MSPVFTENVPHARSIRVYMGMFTACLSKNLYLMYLLSTETAVKIYLILSLVP